MDKQRLFFVIFKRKNIQIQCSFTFYLSIEMEIINDLSNTSTSHLRIHFAVYERTDHAWCLNYSAFLKYAMWIGSFLWRNIYKYIKNHKNIIIAETDKEIYSSCILLQKLKCQSFSCYLVIPCFSYKTMIYWQNSSYSFKIRLNFI